MNHQDQRQAEAAVNWNDDPTVDNDEPYDHQDQRQAEAPVNWNDDPAVEYAEPYDVQDQRQAVIHAQAEEIAEFEIDENNRQEDEYEFHVLLQYMERPHTVEVDPTANLPNPALPYYA